MPATDFVTLASGAKQWSPYRSVTGDYRYLVIGEGDATTDDAAIATAVTALQTWGKGTLVLDGSPTISTTIDFGFYPINVEMLPSSDPLTIDSTDYGFTAFSWGTSSWSPFSSATPVAFTMSDTDRSYITPASGEYAAGTWLCMWSDNSLQSVVMPHGASGSGDTFDPRPMELHRVAYWDASTGRAYLDDPVVDYMSINAKFSVVPMLEDVVVEGLKVEHSGSQGKYSNLIYAKRINGLRVYGLSSHSHGHSNIWPTLCANVDIAGAHIMDTERTDLVYGVIAGLVNGFKFRDSIVSGTRHPFSTTAGATRNAITVASTASTDVLTASSAHGLSIGDTVQFKEDFAGTTARTTYYVKTVPASTTFTISETAGGATFDLDADDTGGELWGVRWGTPLNVKVSNVTANCFAKYDYSVATEAASEGNNDARDAFSTHSEGYGVEFDGCTVNLTGNESNTGMIVRARNTIIKNCVFRGDYNGSSGVPQTIGIEAMARETVIQNCIFEQLRQGINVYSYDSDAFVNDRIRILNNTFRDIGEAGVRVYCGDDCWIGYNVFDRCGATNGTSRAAIMLDDATAGLSPTGVRVFSNWIPKTANLYTVDMNGVAETEIEMHGNICLGYGSGDLGVDGTNAAAVESAYASLNTVDA